MSILENKIDFVVLISVNNANPNGDPLMETDLGLHTQVSGKYLMYA